MKPLIIAILVIALGVGGYIFYQSRNTDSVACTMEAKLCPDGSYVGRVPPSCNFAPCPQDQSIGVSYLGGASSDMITVSSPAVGATITSPIRVTGQARGTWYFEASFPIKIYDSTGRLLGEGPAEAQSEWMTEDFVPFVANIEFATPTVLEGNIVLQNDNPSGLPENEKSMSFPVKFMVNSSTQTIKLYEYDATKDSDATGNPQCSINGLVAVERDIPSTATPLRDSIELLLRGGLTQAEKSRGLSTEFPLLGLKLTNAQISNGVATLTFSDPQNKTSGGSCRVNILRLQIEETAKQFSSVNSVRIMPSDIFQP